ncbi:MAG: co-chaperone GroES [Nanoarchaeota archaeon]|nr:co-chaperone GroES [Nanoarchaeota archaeon]
MKLKPLGNRAVIRPIEMEEKTKSGLYIPDSAKDKPLEAEVIAVSDAKEMPLKVGDKVLYESFGGTEIKIDGKKHLVIDIKDILAKVE